MRDCGETTCAAEGQGGRRDQVEARAASVVSDDEDRVLLDELRSTFGDLSSLSALQRILLTTDGTVTHVLEAFAGEPMNLVKLSQSYELSPAEDPELGLADGEAVIRRRILLQGRVSGQNYLYAESVIMPNRLQHRLHHDLVHTNEPIGRLLVQSRVETFRELVSWGLEPSGEVAAHFGMEETEHLVSRTYRMLSQQQPIMVITEKFPASAFRRL